MKSLRIAPQHCADRIENRRRLALDVIFSRGNRATVETPYHGQIVRLVADNVNSRAAPIPQRQKVFDALSFVDACGDNVDAVSVPLRVNHVAEFLIERVSSRLSLVDRLETERKLIDFRERVNLRGVNGSQIPKCTFTQNP